MTSAAPLHRTRSCSRLASLDVTDIPMWMVKPQPALQLRGENKSVLLFCILTLLLLGSQRCLPNRELKDSSSSAWSGERTAETDSECRSTIALHHSALTARPSACGRRSSNIITPTKEMMTQQQRPLLLFARAVAIAACPATISSSNTYTMALASCTAITINANNVQLTITGGTVQAPIITITGSRSSISITAQGGKFASVYMPTGVSSLTTGVISVAGVTISSASIPFQFDGPVTGLTMTLDAGTVVTGPSTCFSSTAGLVGLTLVATSTTFSCSGTNFYLRSGISSLSFTGSDNTFRSGAANFDLSATSLTDVNVAFTGTTSFTAVTQNFLAKPTGGGNSVTFSVASTPNRAFTSSGAANVDCASLTQLGLTFTGLSVAGVGYNVLVTSSQAVTITTSGTFTVTGLIVSSYFGNVALITVTGSTGANVMSMSGTYLMNTGGTSTSYLNVGFVASSSVTLAVSGATFTVTTTSLGNHILFAEGSDDISVQVDTSSFGITALPGTSNQGFCTYGFRLGTATATTFSGISITHGAGVTVLTHGSLLNQFSACTVTGLKLQLAYSTVQCNAGMLYFAAQVTAQPSPSPPLYGVDFIEVYLTGGTYTTGGPFLVSTFAFNNITVTSSLTTFVCTTSATPTTTYFINAAPGASATTPSQWLIVKMSDSTFTGIPLLLRARYVLHGDLNFETSVDLTSPLSATLPNAYVYVVSCGDLAFRMYAAGLLSIFGKSMFSYFASSMAATVTVRGSFIVSQSDVAVLDGSNTVPSLSFVGAQSPMTVAAASKSVFLVSVTGSVLTSGLFSLTNFSTVSVAGSIVRAQGSVTNLVAKVISSPIIAGEEVFSTVGGTATFSTTGSTIQCTNAADAMISLAGSTVGDTVNFYADADLKHAGPSLFASNVNSPWSGTISIQGASISIGGANPRFVLAQGQITAPSITLLQCTFVTTLTNFISVTHSIVGLTISLQFSPVVATGDIMQFSSANPKSNIYFLADHSYLTSQAAAVLSSQSPAITTGVFRFVGEAGASLAISAVNGITFVGAVSAISLTFVAASYTSSTDNLKFTATCSACELRVEGAVTMTSPNLNIDLGTGFQGNVIGIATTIGFAFLQLVSTNNVGNIKAAAIGTFKMTIEGGDFSTKTAPNVLLTGVSSTDSVLLGASMTSTESNIRITGNDFPLELWSATFSATVINVHITGRGLSFTSRGASFLTSSNNPNVRYTSGISSVGQSLLVTTSGLTASTFQGGSFGLDFANTFMGSGLVDNVICRPSRPEVYSSISMMGMLSIRNAAPSGAATVIDVRNIDLKGTVSAASTQAFVYLDGTTVSSVARITLSSSVYDSTAPSGLITTKLFALANSGFSSSASAGISAVNAINTYMGKHVAFGAFQTAGASNPILSSALLTISCLMMRSTLNFVELLPISANTPMVNAGITFIGIYSISDNFFKASPQPTTQLSVLRFDKVIMRSNIAVSVVSTTGAYIAPSVTSLCTRFNGGNYDRWVNRPNTISVTFLTSCSSGVSQCFHTVTRSRSANYSDTSTQSRSETASRSREVTFSESPSQSMSLSASTSQSDEHSASETSTISQSSSLSPTATSSDETSASTTHEQSVTESSTFSASLSQSDELSASRSITYSLSEELSASRTVTTSSTPSVSLSTSLSDEISGSRSLSLTSTMTETLTVSEEITASRSITSSLSREVTGSVTLSSSLTLSNSLSATSTLSNTETSTLTSSLSDSLSDEPTATDTLTDTPSVSISASLSLTPSLSLTSTASLSEEMSASETDELTATMSRTITFSEERSNTPSAETSLSDTMSPTKELTDSKSLSSTFSLSDTPSVEPSATKTFTLTREDSASRSQTDTKEQTASASVSSSGTISLSPEPTASPSDEKTISDSSEWTYTGSGMLTTSNSTSGSVTLTNDISDTRTVTVTDELSDSGTNTETDQETRTVESETVSTTSTFSLTREPTGTFTASLSKATMQPSMTNTFTEGLTDSPSFEFTLSRSVSPSLEPTSSRSSTFTVSDFTFTRDVSNSITSEETVTGSVTGSLSLTSPKSKSESSSWSVTTTLTVEESTSRSTTISLTEELSDSRSTTEELTFTKSGTPTEELSSTQTFTFSNEQSKSKSSSPSGSITEELSASFSFSQQASPTKTSSFSQEGSVSVSTNNSLTMGTFSLSDSMTLTLSNTTKYSRSPLASTSRTFSLTPERTDSPTDEDTASRTASDSASPTQTASEGSATNEITFSHSMSSSRTNSSRVSATTTLSRSESMSHSDSVSESSTNTYGTSPQGRVTHSLSRTVGSLSSDHTFSWSPSPSVSCSGIPSLSKSSSDSLSLSEGTLSRSGSAAASQTETFTTSVSEGTDSPVRTASVTITAPKSMTESPNQTLTLDTQTDMRTLTETYNSSVTESTDMTSTGTVTLTPPPTRTQTFSGTLHRPPSGQLAGFWSVLFAASTCDEYGIYLWINIPLILGTIILFLLRLLRCQVPFAKLHTYAGISMFRSLLVQHVYLAALIPCHLQCFFGHWLMLLLHANVIWILLAAFTIMFPAATIAHTLFAIVLTVLIAQVPRPLFHWLFYRQGIRRIRWQRRVGLHPELRFFNFDENKDVEVDGSDWATVDEAEDLSTAYNETEPSSSEPSPPRTPTPEPEMVLPEVVERELTEDAFNASFSFEGDYNFTAGVELELQHPETNEGDAERHMHRQGLIGGRPTWGPKQQSAAPGSDSEGPDYSKTFLVDVDVDDDVFGMDASMAMPIEDARARRQSTVLQRGTSTVVGPAPPSDFSSSAPAAAAAPWEKHRASVMAMEFGNDIGDVETMSSVSIESFGKDEFNMAKAPPEGPPKSASSSARQTLQPHDLQSLWSFGTQSRDAAVPLAPPREADWDPRRAGGGDEDDEGGDFGGFFGTNWSPVQSVGGTSSVGGKSGRQKQTEDFHSPPPVKKRNSLFAPSPMPFFASTGKPYYADSTANQQLPAMHEQGDDAAHGADQLSLSSMSLGSVLDRLSSSFTSEVEEIPHDMRIKFTVRTFYATAGICTLLAACVALVGSYLLRLQLDNLATCGSINFLVPGCYLFDFVVGQPVYMCLVYLYRYLTTNEARTPNGAFYHPLFRELHPYNDEVRVMSAHQGHLFRRKLKQSEVFQSKVERLRQEGVQDPVKQLVFSEKQALHETAGATSLFFDDDEGAGGGGSSSKKAGGISDEPGTSDETTGTTPDKQQPAKKPTVKPTPMATTTTAAAAVSKTTASSARSSPPATPANKATTAAAAAKVDSNLVNPPSSASPKATNNNNALEETFLSRREDAGDGGSKARGRPAREPKKKPRDWRGPRVVKHESNASSSSTTESD